MKTRFLTAVLILSALFFTTEVSHACPSSPEADLIAFREYVVLGRSVILDGSGSYSYGSGGLNGIWEFEWDFTNDVSYDYSEDCWYGENAPDGAFDGKTTYTYAYNGTYTVKLRVTDEDYYTDTDTCTINVSGDFDGDGLPDDYEDDLDYDLDNTDPNDADQDFDSDGYNNLSEYLHGSVPNDANSTPDPNFNITIYVPVEVDSIQRAINASIHGDTIVVSEGTYYENIDFDGKAITLTSTDPDNAKVVAGTIIDAQGSGIVVTFNTSEDADSVLKGFTITGGYTGVYCVGTSPTISNCTVTENGSGNNEMANWNFDEEEGDIVYDSVGDNHGTIHGAERILLYPPNFYLEFDGIDDYVEVDHDVSLNITGDITISAWIYPEKENEYQGIVTKTIGSGTTDNPYDFRTTNSYIPRLCLVRADASGHEAVYSTQDLSLNDWNHIVVTVKNNDVDFYIDGDVTGKYGTLTKTPTGNSRPLYIGRRDDRYYFEGYVDGVMLFDRAITSSEASDLFNGKVNAQGGMSCFDSASPKITNCTFYSNNSEDDGGGMYNNDSSPTLTNCVFANNTADDYGGGVCNDNSSPILTNCTVKGNSAFYGGGMSNKNNSEPSITNCIFWDNEHDYQSGNPQIYGGSPTVTFSDIQGGWSGTGNINDDPGFENGNAPAGPDGLFGTRDDGLAICFGSPCVDKGSDSAISETGVTTDIIGNQRIADGDHQITAPDSDEPTVDMGAYELPTIWFVDKDATGSDNGTSWDDAFEELRDALTSGDPDDEDEIWVAEGTYKPTDDSDRMKSFELIEGVGIYGGFGGTETGYLQRDWTVYKPILSGDIGTPGSQIDNSHNIVRGADNAVLDGFTIQDGQAASVPPPLPSIPYGGGMYNYYVNPTVINCVFSNNSASGYGGGMYNHHSNPIVKNCIFSENSAYSGGAIYSYYSDSALTNCTFSGNSAGGGGGMYNWESNPTLTNCILWGDSASVIGDEIYNEDSNPKFRYCDVMGCDGSDDWDTSFGTDLGGNIDEDPCFADSDNPAGIDSIFYTPDDGLRLTLLSPCIDAADGDEAPVTDVSGDARLDMEFAPNKGTGDPDYADIGAYEYYNYSGYITSFEEYQGYVVDGSIDNVDGWQVDSGSATVKAAQYKYGSNPEDFHSYQRVQVSEASTISYNTADSRQKSFVRISCIPSSGSSINVMNGSSPFPVASIKFGEDGGPEDKKIYVWDDGDYFEASTDHYYYDVIAAKCRDFLNDPDNSYNDPCYSYENTWIEFVIEFDWENHTYDVSWAHYDVPDGASIYTGASFDSSHNSYTEIEFIVPDNLDDHTFELNRMSVSDMALSGGVVGPGEDAWLISPVADILNPLKGRCSVAGPMWYDKLGEYVIKCCPVDLDTSEPNNWIEVCSGRSISQYPILLGFWNTERFYNGDYFLKIEIYDDLRQLIAGGEGIIEIERRFNGRSKMCNVRYPVTGRSKPRAFHSEEQPDVTINWPGTFPFEFKRTYNDGLRSRLYPLFCGWTHNHNIRLMEDSQYDWMTDEENDPCRDDNGLGIGRLWLCQPLGGVMFIGHVNDVDPEQVIYEPLDKENHYIIRSSSLVTGGDNPVFDVTYVYYMPDGMRMTFQKRLKIYYPVLEDEGLVDWMVVVGITKQADRFDNALVYEWSGFTEEDGNDVFLDKISAKINEGKGNEEELPANLQFSYEFAPFGPENGPQDLCSGVTLDDGDPLTTDAELTFQGGLEFPFHYYVYYAIKDDPIGSGEENNWNRYEYCLEPIFVLYKIYRTGEAGDFCDVRITASRDDEGSLVEKRVENEGPAAVPVLIEQYNYDYDKEGNLITTIKVHFGPKHSPNVYCLLRKEVTVTSPEGALLSKDITTFKMYDSSDEEFDPYDYQNPGNWIWDFYFHAGGGGAIDTEYFYEDDNFPFKPTTIIVYFDDDGDGLYDRPSKKTMMKYDGRGNLTEQKVYVDSENYVYTEYDYHQDYDFPIRQTTWQGYCYDDGQTVVTSGARVEKKWLYGDADGTPIADGNQGDYLVQKSVLLDDTIPEDWADTLYTYIPEGQVESREDPCGNITYYTYDSYAFKSKEWQGATLASGYPTGNPQKRYYYDGLGRKILEADYLGKVQMNVYDPWRRVTQARIYDDEDAVDLVERPDSGVDAFEPDFYDELPLCDHDGEKICEHLGEPGYKNDWWENRTLYSYSSEYFHDKPTEITLPTSGVVKRGYHNNGKYNYYYGFSYAEGGINSARLGDDGRLIYEQRNCNPQDIRIACIYDSMFRLLHNYSFFDDIPGQPVWKYIKHEEYRYDASGNKTYEAVYSAEKDQYGIFGSGILEKANSYEYDVMNRLTKQVVDCTEGGLNQTTEYGYDAVGNRIYVVDPAGNVIFTDYDNANRKICEYFAEAPVYVPGTYEINFAATKANAVPRKEVSYYKNGKVKDSSSYDYDGTTVLSYAEFTFDSRGRIKTVTEQINALEDASTQYYYKDDCSLEIPADSEKYHIVIEVNDVEGKKTGIRLSYHEKNEKVTYPSGDYEEYVYYSESLDFVNPDPACKNNGLLQEKKVWDGITKDKIEYDYDEFGKVKEITYPDGSLLYTYTARTLGEYGMVEQITDKRNAYDRPGDDESKFTFDYWYLSGNVKSYEDYEGDEINKGYTVYYDYLRAYDRPTEVQVTDPDETVIYHVKNSYDLAGRLIDVSEPLLTQGYQLIAGFDYDDNGNRSRLTHYRNGSATGPTTYTNYFYNLDNLMTYFTTIGGPTFAFDATDSGDIDGLGRLKNADETISKTSGTVNHSYTFDYDMRSQLKQGVITNIGSSQWQVDYSYKLDGNIEDKTIDGTKITEYGYNSDLMTSASSTTGGENFSLGWDLNGQMTNLPYSGITTELVWNWDGKLRSGTKDNDTIELKYDPMGNRVLKNVNSSDRKYVLDISGKLPVILMELNNSGGIEKTYIYADSQIIAQHDGDHDDYRYFYLHDRLGSIRQVINTSGNLENSYTFDPFGEGFATEIEENISNPFQFTGQYLDAEIEEYYLRARMYDPKTMRFNSRDPVRGKFAEPVTLHKYLYCLNDPVNRIDPTGASAMGQAQAIVDAYVMKNEAWNAAAYSTHPEDWRYFDLAEMFVDLMLPAMLGGYLSPGPVGDVADEIKDILEKIEGINVGGISIDDFLYHLDKPGADVLSAPSYILLQVTFYIQISTSAYDISFDDMDEYYRWKDNTTLSCFKD